MPTGLCRPVTSSALKHGDPIPAHHTGTGAEVSPALSDTPATRAARLAMVHVIRAYGVTDERVLAAMSAVRRHGFFPSVGVAPETAYGDHPVPIGMGQTISQPFIVAYMTEKLTLRPGERVLEIGTGSGYQAAVLAACGVRVYSLERVPALAEHASRVLAAEGWPDVRVKCADGYAGWADEAPFDAIIGTCAPATVPETLCGQLAVGGRMILPVGEGNQRLVIVRRTEAGLVQIDDLPVRFVPMVNAPLHGTENPA